MINELSRIVREVGNLLCEWRNSKIFEGVWNGSQYKAKADQMAHNALSVRLRKACPTMDIVSEEDVDSYNRKRPERYWLIDPIDGTASFINGYHGFVTQIALMSRGRPVLSVVYAPLLDALYYAERGCGSFLNGERLHLSVTSDPKILIDNYPEPRGVAAVLYNDLHFMKYIECGSIALKICKVADGTADVFFKDVAVRDWDIAAPQLVLEEAGGVMKDNKGKVIIYDGDCEHSGIIAAVSDDACTRVISWYANLNKRNIS